MTTKANLITIIRDGHGLCRTVAGIVAFSVLWLSVFPSLLAAQELSGGERNVQENAEVSSEDKLNAALVELESTIRNQSTIDVWESVEKIESEMRELDTEIMSGFDEVAAMIDEKELPEAIVARHIGAVSEYQAQFNSLFVDIDNVRKERDSKKRAKGAVALADRLGSIKKKRSQQKENMDSLPSRSLQPKPNNLPKLTAADFVLDDPIGDRRSLLASVEPPLPSGDDAFSNPDWLSESDEVELTQAIIDKATELKNDPVTIYHWVRNSIRWNPNWGAKQTAQLTLELRSGNSIDIASLTIALMRAAGVPARYVHGTIDVPEDQFRNWAGGFAESGAALVYAASGGIPTTSITNGGVVTKARIEHVWVEVAVDYVPARAAKNVTPDSWIAIDPSFKQFVYSDSIEQLSITGLDTAAVGQNFVNSGTVNPDGSVSGFDTSIVVDAQDNAIALMEAHIADNIPNPTVGDAFGDRSLIIQEFPVLASELPYEVVVEGTRYSLVPQNLQQRMQFGLGTTVFGQIANPLNLSWAAVNNKKITLAFTPETSDDVAVLNALAPSNEVADFSELPSNLPAYLISVVPELRINDEVVATGDPMPLGTEMVFHFNPTIAGLGTLSYNYSVVSGSYLNVAAVGNDVSQAAVSRANAKLEQVAADLMSLPPLSLAVQRDELMGELFQAGLLGYYSSYVAYADLLASGNRDQHQLAAGLGSFGYEPKLQSLFGIPRSIGIGSIIGDLPLVRVIALNEGGNGERPFSSLKDFNVALGIIGSTLEHSVPEALFSQIGQSGSEATSAIKALNIASDQGQTIFSINQSNIATTLGLVNQDADILNEIQSAVAAGLEVIIHAAPISNAGFQGAGYIILDPVTGDGAYKISGGANGFFWVLLIAFMLIIVTLAMHAIAAATLLSWPLFFLVFETSTFFFWVDQIKKAETDADLGEAHTKTISIMVLPYLWEAGIAAGLSAQALSALAFGAVMGKMIATVAG